MAHEATREEEVPSDASRARGRALTREQAQTRAALIKAPRYRVHLDLTRDGGTFGSEVEVEFRCEQPGADTFVELAAERLHAAELNGRALDVGSFDGMRLPLRGLAARNVLRVSAACAYAHTGNGLHRFVDPVDGAVYLYSHFEPREAHRVLACFDQPDIKGTFDVTARAPAGWRVASNMAPVDQPEPGTAGLWRFPTTPEMSTYLAALVAGPYHIVRERHGDIELGLWCRRSLAEHLDPDEIFTVTRQGLDFFEELFAQPYPFGGKYDQAFVPEFNAGAMENAGLVTINELYVFRSKVTDASRESRAQTILHELAHMWFGNLVTMRWWDDLWLNESFATYMGHLAQARATRFTNSWTTFAKKMKTWAYAQDQLPTTHPIVADVPDTESARTNFDGISYAKGASVLKQLVAWVGESAFVKGVRDYFRRHAFGNADLAAFLGCLEEASARDLTAWSVEWLQTAGLNTIAPVVAVDGDRYREVHLQQTAGARHPAVRSHRLAIGLYDHQGGRLARRRRLELDVVGSETAVADLAGEQVPALLLVNDEDLAFAKVRLDARSLRTATEQLAMLDDDLARSLCWNAAWDMVRDAEMRARDFVAMVLRAIGAESDVGVVQSLLAQAQQAISTFGAPAHRAAIRQRFAEAALQAARAATPGGDMQLAWARAFLATARSDQHLHLLEQLLEDGDAIPGLSVDTEVRWSIVGTLAKVGSGDAAIEAEVARDPTDAGSRYAAAARAARPTREAKQQAWTAMMDPALPLATARAIAGVLPGVPVGFMVDEQPKLLASYRTPYFEHLSLWWDERNPEVALHLARGLYPRVPLDPSLLDATDRALAGELPGPLARVLLEARDEAARALRAQAYDQGE